MSVRQEGKQQAVWTRDNLRGKDIFHLLSGVLRPGVAGWLARERLGVTTELQRNFPTDVFPDPDLEYLPRAGKSHYTRICPTRMSRKSDAKAEGPSLWR